MAKIKFILWKYDNPKDGEYPIYLRANKGKSTKYISLGYSASLDKWDDNFQRITIDSIKGKKRNVEHENINAFLSEQETKINDILFDFDKNKIDWTLSQFENAFLNKSKQGNVKKYFDTQIKTLRETGHIGNANCYERTFHMMELFDKKINSKIFSEIDLKYIQDFNTWLQKPRTTVYVSTKGKKRVVDRDGLSGNSRLNIFKALRAVINKAIKEKEASEITYPFGKNGFEVAALEEETQKRYLPSEYLAKVKNTPSGNFLNEYARKLFLFSYFSFGMSIVDMARLTDKHIKTLEGGKYIVYKREKTKKGKRATAINIKLTDTLISLISDLQNMVQPAENYLLPIISVEGLTGEKLYNHIKGRAGKYNDYLKRLATEFDIDDINLTSYVSRHSMSMTLQGNEVPEEVISQILNHKDLKTTKTYLDSFGSKVIDEAAKGL